MNRRNFVEKSLLAGTWSLLAPHANAIGANAEIRVAVIGFNGRGKSHINDLLRVKGCRLVALCDVDPKILAAKKAELAKSGVDVATYDDYRKLCAAPDIDAVSIATPNHTHALIALTAAAHGKHVYVEKPVSHNVWEGRQLAIGAERYKVIIQHGFQRRSESAWEDAFAWLAEGHLGQLKLARGFCYKPRPSIGKVSAPTELPEGLNYDLWCGPRPVAKVMREKFHYDWHWQLPYGNGDLGNQGPHQLDVCRWALGDPILPERVLSLGGRLGYEDDGQTANTQLLWLEHAGKAPILFEVRGLPKSKMDYKSGVDSFQGQSVGNVLEYEHGSLRGEHTAKCTAYDRDDKEIKSFNGKSNPFERWIRAIEKGKIDTIRGVESGHYSSALAHLGNISLHLGKQQRDADTKLAPPMVDALDRMQQHLEANGIDAKKAAISYGPLLQFNPQQEKFVGAQADAANSLLREEMRAGFTLPV